MFKPVDNVWTPCGKVLGKLVSNRPQLPYSTYLRLLITRKTLPSPHKRTPVLTHLLHNHKTPSHHCLSVTYPHFPQGLLIQPLKKI